MFVSQDACICVHTFHADVFCPVLSFLKFLLYLSLCILTYSIVTSHVVPYLSSPHQAGQLLSCLVRLILLSLAILDLQKGSRSYKSQLSVYSTSSSWVPAQTMLIFFPLPQEQHRLLPSSCSSSATAPPPQPQANLQGSTEGPRCARGAAGAETLPCTVALLKGSH